ncbi:MAG: sulfite exporter TauE/SafE family protein [Treponemataceae bacterium]
MAGYFLITIIASFIGSLSGVGPGVIMKPLFDSIGALSVSVVSFLCGCTSLAMASMALVASRKSPVRIDIKRSSFLAMGACVGGVIGKQLFVFVKIITGNEVVAGLLQGSILLFANILVIFYVLFKTKIHTQSISNPITSIFLGILLGILSSFLGIGGGPFNIVALAYFYSMAPKETALNSIFIMFFSQATSLFTTFVTKTIPVFDASLLFLMCLGGIIGAFVGGFSSKKITEKFLETFFLIVLLLLIVLNTYNIILFLNKI